MSQSPAPVRVAVKTGHLTRSKFSRAKFKATCLAEYAETFKTVCADAGYYQFPTAQMLDGYFSQAPADFKLYREVKVKPSGKLKLG